MCVCVCMRERGVKKLVIGSVGYFIRKLYTVDV